MLQRRTSKKGLSIKLIAEVTKLDDKKILDLKRTLYIKERKTKCRYASFFFMVFSVNLPKKWRFSYKL